MAAFETLTADAVRGDPARSWRPWPIWANAKCEAELDAMPNPQRVGGFTREEA